MTLEDALSEFIEWGGVKYANSTLYTYTDLIKRFIAYIGNVETTSVSFIDSVRYFKYLKKKGYAESSIAYMMISVRTFFKFISSKGESGFDYQMIAIPKYVNKSYVPVQAAEINKMIRSIKSDDFISLRNKTIISFLYSSGVRVSELCDLKVDELDMKKRYATIISKKNRIPAMIFWDHRTSIYLEKYLEERKAISNSEYVFVSMSLRRMGEKMSTRTIERVFSYYRINKESKPHGVRHGFGQRLVKSNVSLVNCKAFMRHKSIYSTERYLRTFNPDLIRAYKSLKD